RQGEGEGGDKAERSGPKHADVPCGGEAVRLSIPERGGGSYGCVMWGRSRQASDHSSQTSPQSSRRALAWAGLSRRGTKRASTPAGVQSLRSMPGLAVFGELRMRGAWGG